MILRQIELSAIFRQIEFVSQFRVPVKMHIRSILILIEMTFPELLDVGCFVIFRILMTSLQNVMPFISPGNRISIKCISQCCCLRQCSPFQISIIRESASVHSASSHWDISVVFNSSKFETQTQLNIQNQRITIL